MDDLAWEQVRRLVGWLDEHAEPAAAGDVRLLRVLKIGEEFGEVAEALHGALGANPRKGASHTWDDVRQELCDVIVTAMVALATCTDGGDGGDGPGGPAEVLAGRLRLLVERAGLDAPPGDGVR
ncbi:MazG-like family protein [Streptomyces roseirectus]|uniref:MazG-like family protein n=1 Tax=Streptomyces roseirectus TaxID=2768066 RepID=A0A7H0IEH9_9ACTN|nr:MazG-like family protein [Streptomyces roseirectus]QNP71195.1 MazG-like family protein [Streptomyces roseirectus]